MPTELIISCNNLCKTNLCFQLFGAKVAELEAQQRILEQNLRKFLHLKRELSSFQQEAEETDKLVNDFIKVRREAELLSFLNGHLPQSRKCPALICRCKLN